MGPVWGPFCFWGCPEKAIAPDSTCDTLEKDEALFLL